MSGTATSFVAAAVLFAVWPAVVLRGELARRYATVDLSTSLLAVLLFFNGAQLALQEERWWLAIFVVVKVAQLSIFLARSPDEAGASTPRALGVFAALFFLSLVPHMLQSPIDGDETYYTLLTDSLVHDHDLDLRNQYAESTRLIGRPVAAQFGDPIGAHGELYSRHEPFLSMLLIPGYASFGIGGAAATVAVFGGLLIFSLLSLVREEVPSFKAALLLPFIAGPPVLYYATRIWPEVPAAFCFSQALRHRSLRNPFRFGIYLVLLSALKLRFALIAVPLLLIVALSSRRDWKRIVIVGLLLLLPFAALLLFDPGVFSVRPLDAVSAPELAGAWRGALGLLVDAQAGLLFQAPLLFAGLLLAFSRRPSRGLAVGFGASVLYLLFLFPRSEWHGGWSPPLRYIVVFMPLFALGAAVLLQRLRLPARAIFGVATAALAVHGIAEPAHLFHIANGESELGEVLSAQSQTDFSRLLPSLIRPNAAVVAYALIMVAVVAFLVLAQRRTDESRFPAVLVPALISLLLLGMLTVGKSPGSLVQLEDAHVRHTGGRLYPEYFTVARFRFQGGWTFTPGDQATFLIRPGQGRLRYFAVTGAVMTLDGTKLSLSPSPNGKWKTLEVSLPDRHDHVLQAVAGEVTVDRIEHE